MRAFEVGSVGSLQTQAGLECELLICTGLLEETI